MNDWVGDVSATLLKNLFLNLEDKIRPTGSLIRFFRLGICRAALTINFGPRCFPKFLKCHKITFSLISLGPDYVSTIFLVSREVKITSSLKILRFVKTHWSLTSLAIIADFTWFYPVYWLKYLFYQISDILQSPDSLLIFCISVAGSSNEHLPRLQSDGRQYHKSQSNVVSGRSRSSPWKVQHNLLS